MTRQSSTLSAPISTRTIHSTSPTSSSTAIIAPRLPGLDFPNQVAVFNDRFCFTTLSHAEAVRGSRGLYVHPTTRRTCSLFSLDDHMAYIPFSRDFGPLNLAFTYAACLAMHDKIGARESTRSRPVCLYTSPDPKIKSNMALMVALYFLIVRHESPSQCFMPIASFELMPFRDAGNGDFDHALSIQDCLYGMHKAMEFGLLDLSSFDAAEYQHYETPQNGDLNILGPFIAFASPIEPAWAKVMSTRQAAIKSAIKAKQPPPIFRLMGKSRLGENHGFKSVLEVFKRQDVGVVVRLNDELYDKRHFTDADIHHVEMYFDDGSNPSDDIIREFIALAERYMGEDRMVAVHCKAGLGRTGVLIGAYLIYKYGFTAQEAIGYMRIVRPGMVVNAQQQFMLLNQMKWAGWAARDELLREIGAQNLHPANPLATPPSVYVPMLSRLALPPSFSKPQHVPLQSLSHPSSSSSPKRGDAVGQPRKTGPVPPTHVEVQSPTPEPEDRLARNRQEYKESTSHEQSKGKEGSTRGTKRGATRKPIPIPPTDDGPTTPTRLGMDILERSPSILSVTSANDRPRKRMHGQSPLGPPSPGLASPPPTRASSPDVPRPVTDEMVIDEQLSYTPPPPPSRIPRILRKETSSARLKSTYSSIGSGVDHSLPPPLPSKATSSTSAPSRLPGLTGPRKQSPLKEIHAIQAGEAYVNTSPSRIPRAVPISRGLDVDGIKGVDGKEKKVVAKETWAPPRLMSLLYNIGRSGTA